MPRLGGGPAGGWGLAGGRCFGPAAWERVGAIVELVVMSIVAEPWPWVEVVLRWCRDRV